MSDHRAKRCALEVARDNGYFSAGDRVLDTHHKNAAAYVITIANGVAVVVYEDEPNCVVSCGNDDGRWIAG